MKSFSDEQIQKQEQTFLDKQYPIRYAYIQGVVDQGYFVLPKDMAPDLTNFVFRMSGEGSQHLYGISEEVPVPFRKYAIAHEVIEFEHAHKHGHTDDACVYALEKELALIPEDIKPEYLKMRKEFFSQLYTYANKFDKAYTDEDRAQFRANEHTLEELLK